MSETTKTLTADQILSRIKTRIFEKRLAEQVELGYTTTDKENEQRRD